jgi:predicted ATP-dependent endonuclease of OLD family
MLVEKIIIHNFKSVAKNCELEVSKTVTSLVGANQSGKTNILRAIEKFSSGKYQLDDICDFSAPAKASEIDEQLPMITVIFRIEDNDKDFKGISPRFPKINELRVTKKYNGEYVLALPGIKQDDSMADDLAADLNERAIEIAVLLDHIRDEWEGLDEEISKVEDMIGEFIGSLGTDVKSEVITVSPRPSALLKSVNESFGELLSLITVLEQEAETEEEAAKGKESAKQKEEDERGEAKAEKVKWEEIKENYLQVMSRLEGMIKEYEDITLSSEEIASKIESSLPKFIYVSAEHESLLKGEVDLDKLKDASQEDIQFVSIHRLLKLANLGLNELTRKTPPVRRRQRLADAADSVTDILQKVWKQQKISVSLELAGANERVLRIYLSSDGGPERYPEQQSYGFRWYLEFYLGYALAVGEDNKKHVFLLDEPGIHLHPLAQRNLVDVLREIANRNQVIHTTHHTDMLDLESPENWRVVENDESGRIGTFITGDAHLSGEDGIGFEVITKTLWGSGIVPTLLIGPKNLVVEGLADIFLLGTASKLLGGENVEDSMLVNGEIAMIHTGGLSHYRKILAFCNRPELNTVAFFDSDEAGRKKKNEVIKNKIIAADKTVEINDAYASDATEERDIEHIFGFNLLKDAAMQVYGADLPPGFDFKKDELPTKGALGRRFKDFFKSKGVDKYDKAKVALALKSILLENNNKFTDSSRQRFKALFGKIRESFNQ